jgi:hypothetical protein
MQKNKRAVKRDFLLLLSGVILVFLLLVVSSQAFWDDWKAAASQEFNHTEVFFNNSNASQLDRINGTGEWNNTLVAVQVNISINRTYGGGIANSNVTEVTFILPTNWSFVAGSQLAKSNSTNNGVYPASTVFTNTTANATTGQMLSWINVTGVLSVTKALGNDSNYFMFSVITNNPSGYNITAPAYNITVVTINGSAAVNTTFKKNLSVQVWDVIAPSANWSSNTPANYSNITTTGIIANLSWSDAGQMNTINITLLNSALAPINSTTNISVNRGHFNSTYYNFTNTTGLPDGVYYLNVSKLNDSMNNVNLSNLFLRKITIDRTAPATPTFSCTPTTVNSGQTVTCTCTGTDATTGVQSTTYNSTPSTSGTGTFTETCIVGDYAGHNTSTTATYTVISGEGPSTGGSTVTGTTYTPSETQLSTGYTQSLSSNKGRVKLSVDGKTHYVSIATVTATSATIRVASNLTEVSLNVGGETKIDVSGDSFYDVYVKLLSINSTKANLEIKKIHEAIPAGAGKVSTTGGTVVTPGEEGGTPSTATGNTAMIIGIIILVLAIAIGGGIAMKKKK